MKYKLETTINHSKSIEYSDCLIDINELIVANSINDLINPFIENNFLVIDGDKIEKRNAIKNNLPRNNSMDMVFGISNNKKSAFLLVDFKFNVENPNNLSKKDLVGKVNGSKILFENEIEIIEKFYLIFKNGIKQQARNRLQRMIPSLNNSYIPIYLEDLKTIFFD